MFIYNGWANQIVIDTLMQANITDEYIVKIMSHIINAQFTWLGRIINYPHNYSIWGILSIEQIQKSSQENNGLWLDYLAKTTPEELTRNASYSNSSGEYFETAIIDIMAHVINHSTYHRAQIAKALRDLGIAPPNTDYITYCRKFSYT